MKLKEQLYNHCREKLNVRLEIVQQKMSDIQIALESETKSSAGDKHETGRAMLQLEREKTGNQFAELNKQLQLLSKIDPKTSHKKVGLGSIVKTTSANYFVAVSVGEIKCKEDSFFSISPATPIGKLLLSKQVGETVEFRTQKFKIIDIE